MNFSSLSSKWGLPLLLLLMVTPFTPWLDLTITRYFYTHSNDSVEHFFSYPILDFIYDWGTLPANLVAISSALAILASYLTPRLKKWRNPGLVLLLTYALGTGLFINGVLKEYWGRPRPKQVEEFGGMQAFRPYYQPNFFEQPQPSKSFTCGHCAMGFYFFALALVGNRLKSRWLYGLGLSLAFILGILLSLTRIAQGGHFFSDTLFSAAIMWYTALAMDWLVYAAEDHA